MIFAHWICRWRGHLFGRASVRTHTKAAERYEGDTATVTATFHDQKQKTCKRCGLVREVKSRKAKV